MPRLLTTVHDAGKQSKYKDTKSKQNGTRPQPILTSRALDLSPKANRSSYQQSKYFLLPAELKIIIYDYVFNSTEIHLLNFRTPKDPLESGLFNVYQHWLQSFPCWDTSAISQNRMCACVQQMGLGGNPEQEALEAGLKNLMLTCRAFYHDIVAIVFRYRTFQIDDLNTIILASMARPQRFNSIVSLHLNAQVLRPAHRFSAALPDFPRSFAQHFSHLPPLSNTPSQAKRFAVFPRKLPNPGLWDAACDAISNMTSLRRLKLQLCGDAFNYVLYAKWPEAAVHNEAFVFEPLMRIVGKRDLEVFEVEVDWPEEESGWVCRKKGSLGFALKRREYFGKNQSSLPSSDISRLSSVRFYPSAWV